MTEQVYTGSLCTLYVQETTSNQLDSVSASADTTQLAIGYNAELRFSNTIQEYLECDGTVKYFEGPQKYTMKIKTLVARAELLSALIGADSLASTTYTVSKYSSFLPRLTIHLKLEIGSNELNVNLTNCVLSGFVLTSTVKEIVLGDAEIMAESIGTINWEKDA